jgi:hypothetical protein
LPHFWGQFDTSFILVGQFCENCCQLMVNLPSTAKQHDATTPENVLKTLL